MSAFEFEAPIRQWAERVRSQEERKRAIEEKVRMTEAKAYAGRQVVHRLKKRKIDLQVSIILLSESWEVIEPFHIWGKA